MFEKIGEYEHEMKALWENIRSVPMLRAINKLFVSIVAFITGVGSYMKHGTLCESGPVFLVWTQALAVS